MISTISLVLSAVGVVASDSFTFFPAYSLLPLLIFLGMALIAVGAARSKNAASTSLNQWVILGICSIAFVGFGILIFEGRLPASDWSSEWFSVSASESDSGWRLLLFQLGTVAIALSVACRSMIDRIRLRGLIVFCILFSGSYCTRFLIL